MSFLDNIQVHPDYLRSRCMDPLHNSPSGCGNPDCWKSPAAQPVKVQPLPWQYSDGGRAAAGYKGEARDCVVRAIALAAQLPYKQVYSELHRRAGESPRLGVNKRVYGPYLEALGFQWVPCMRIGDGCTVHLRTGELPGDRALVVRLSRHVAAVVGGRVLDTHNPTRGGARCVYGYWERLR